MRGLLYELRKATISTLFVRVSDCMLLQRFLAGWTCKHLLSVSWVSPIPWVEGEWESRLRLPQKDSCIPVLCAFKLHVITSLHSKPVSKFWTRKPPVTGGKSLSQQSASFRSSLSLKLCCILQSQSARGKSSHRYQHQLIHIRSALAASATEKNAH